MQKPAVGTRAVAEFLASYHGRPVEDLEVLGGGFWSLAYGYRVSGRDLVLRLAHDDEGYRLDRAAMRFAGADLPVPEIVDIGRALDHAFAISARHHGRFLEDVATTEASAAGPTLVRLLDALRQAPARAAAPADDPFEPATGWRGWLTDGLADDPSPFMAGWKRDVATDPHAGPILQACEARIGALLDACPERRDLVHGDLLHQNVLLADDASRVTAVFSWKCATLGDFLYDTAWCTFWGAWHPGIGAAEVWQRMHEPRLELDASCLVDSAARHHCYELHIGAHHLGWYVRNDDVANLRWCADRLDVILERGPMSS